MDTPYNVDLLVGLCVDRQLTEAEHHGCYGFLVGPKEDTPIAAWCLASGAAHAPKGQDLITVFLRSDIAQQNLDKSDAQIIDLARTAMTAIIPSLHPHLLDGAHGSQVFRIPQAMPTCLPGRATTVARYRRQASGPL